MTTPYQHPLECLTCHEHPGPGVRPLKTADACGQCHGGGTDSTSNPPSEGVPYINGTALESAANGMHTRVGTASAITVNVTYSTDAPIAGARAKLFKRKAGAWVMIKSGLTDASGSKTFSNLRLGKKYKVVVIKSSVDFNGAVTGKQSKVTFGNTDPKTTPIKLASDTTINVKQGAPGSLPTINITMP
jgi:hypothetical protein